MSVTEQSVVAAIEEAFADVPYPGDDRVKGGDYDLSTEEDTGGYIGRGFRGRHWRDIPADVLRLNAWHGSLTFMTPDVFHFYLPAFLIGSLHDGEVEEHTSITLTPPPSTERGQHLFYEPIERLTDAQKRAVGMYWAYLRERGDLSDITFERALLYWAKHLPTEM
jgi:hypothetical protein